MAKPRKAIKPRTSVKVIIKTLLAKAGSIPNFFRMNGIETPAIAEAKIFNNIATPTISPICQVVSNNKTDNTETTIDHTKPFNSATELSLISSLRTFERWIFPIAMPLITRIKV